MNNSFLYNGGLFSHQTAYELYRPMIYVFGESLVAIKSPQTVSTL